MSLSQFHSSRPTGNLLPCGHGSRHRNLYFHTLSCSRPAGPLPRARRMCEKPGSPLSPALNRMGLLMCQTQVPAQPRPERPSWPSWPSAINKSQLCGAGSVRYYLRFLQRQSSLPSRSVLNLLWEGSHRAAVLAWIRGTGPPAGATPSQSAAAGASHPSLGTCLHRVLALSGSTSTLLERSVPPWGSLLTAGSQVDKRPESFGSGA